MSDSLIGNTLFVIPKNELDPMNNDSHLFLFTMYSPRGISNFIDGDRLVIPANKLNEPYLRAIERLNKGCPEWEDYLFSLRMLPSWIVHSYMFEPATEQEKEFVRRQNLEFSFVSDWVDHLVTGSKEPSSAVELKPIAELFKAFLDLAIELVDRNAELKQEFGTAQNFWFSSVYDFVHLGLIDCGLFTGEGRTQSKQPVLEAFQDLTEWLESKPHPKPDDDGSATLRLANPETLSSLLIHARLTAKRDSIFREGKAFQNILRELRKQGLNLRKTPGGLLTFKSGKLSLLGRKAPRPREKYKKSEM
jgi:hypothetical protein